MIAEKETLSKRQEEEVRRLSREVQAKNGLPLSRINRALENLDLGKLS